MEMPNEVDVESLRWRIPAAGELLEAEFDGQTVVYHTGVGHTHWVSPVAAEILHLLGIDAMTIGELRDALVDVVSPQDIDLLDESVHEAIERLNNLSLIETT